MKSKTINSLFYTGIVTLSQYSRNKKVPILQLHNSGGNLLFDFLANCLTGDFDLAAPNQPNKIMLLNIEGGIPEDISTLNLATSTITPVSDFIYLLTKPERVNSSDSCTVRYSFSVASEFLASKAFNCIGLYTDKVSPDKTTDEFKNNFVALCKLSTADLEAIPTSSRLVIDWELNISNNSQKNTEADIYVQ